MEPLTIKKVEFIKSSTGAKDCPSGEYPEFAFTGRSNVGKSSLINMLCNRSRIARTSSTPGKTQLINHFLINDSWYLVDLPGYGFARMPEKERHKMMRMIKDYILVSKQLVCLFLLIDVRLDMQKADKEFMQFLGNNHVPFVLIFTKTDKLTETQLKKNMDQYKSSMLQGWESLPETFQTSSLKKTGRKEILGFIQTVLEEE